jgi:serine/threonine protein kinase
MFAVTESRSHANPSRPAPLAPGAELFGHRVCSVLGHGAGATVYRVTAPVTTPGASPAVYALKHVVCQQPKDQRFAEQLAQEHEVSRHVRHPGLRPAVAFHARRALLGGNREAALLMTFVDGHPLEAPAPRVRMAVRSLHHVCRALAALHAAGYVHCDLKPQNVLLTDANGSAQLIDLGQACPVGTVKERIQGTPDFIAPEQVRCLPVTPRTDVYGWGATAYFVLTGRKLPTLFTVKTGDTSFLLDTVIAAPHDLRPRDVPAPLSQLVMDCVRTNPARRPDLAEVDRRLDVLRYALRTAAHARRHRPAGSRPASRAVVTC